MLCVITIFPTLQWISVWIYSIISFPDLRTLGTYTGTSYLGGGTCSSLGFISIHLSGVTTANATALGYQQVSLTSLLVSTSNPAHLFLLKAMPIWESRGSVYGWEYEGKVQEKFCSLPPVLAEVFEFKESNDAGVSALIICQRSEEDNIMTSPVKVQASLSSPESYGDCSDVCSRGWSDIKRAIQTKNFACTIATEIFLNSLLWKTGGFAAFFHFTFTMVLARPTGL